MSISVYVDTNVFMDFLHRKEDDALKFFMRTISCEFTLISSNVVEFELRKYGYSSHSLFKWLGVKLRVEKCTPKDKIFAKSLPTHYADALHAAIAIRTNATLFLSQDKGFSFLDNWRCLDDF